MLKRIGTILMALVLSFSVLPVKVNAESKTEEKVDVLKDAFVSAFMKSVGTGELINIEAEAGEEAKSLESKSGFLLYEVYDDSIEITGHEIPDEMNNVEITIPSSINGFPVTRIREGAFQNCPNLSAVTIEEGVRELGGSAFLGCENLKKVIIPSTLKTLSWHGFSHCNKLTAAGPPGSDANIIFKTIQ